MKKLNLIFTVGIVTTLTFVSCDRARDNYDNRDTERTTGVTAGSTAGTDRDRMDDRDTARTTSGDIMDRTTSNDDVRNKNQDGKKY